MNDKTISTRIPIGQLALIEKAASANSQTAGQWVRDAALKRLNEDAETERLQALEARLADRLDRLDSGVDLLLAVFRGEVK